MELLKYSGINKILVEKISTVNYSVSGWFLVFCRALRPRYSQLGHQPISSGILHMGIQMPEVHRNPGVQVACMVAKNEFHMCIQSTVGYFLKKI